MGKIIKYYWEIFFVGSYLIIGAVFGYAMYQYGIIEGKLRAQAAQQIQEKTLGPALSQYEMDKACIAWLMESNIKEAKLRICGKR